MAFSDHSGADSQPLRGLSSTVCLARPVWDLHSPLRSDSCMLRKRFTDSEDDKMTCRLALKTQRKMTINHTVWGWIISFKEMSEPWQNWLELSGPREVLWLYQQQQLVYKGDDSFFIITIFSALWQIGETVKHSKDQFNLPFTLKLIWYIYPSWLYFSNQWHNDSTTVTAQCPGLVW